MADSKITDLTAATSIGATDQFVLATGGANRKVSGQVLGVATGTSMPGSPATNDRIFRTDLGMEFYYDGTRWLSTSLFREPCATIANLAATAASSYYLATKDTLDMWVVAFEAVTFVSTTNNGTSNWTLTFIKATGPNVQTSLGSFSTGTGPDSANNNVRHTVSVGASVVVATYPFLQVTATKNSTPGNLWGACSVTYRLIGT